MTGAAVHGGRIYEAAAVLNRPWGGIVDFSANINPLGQPLGLKNALFNDFERTLHYPEIRAESLAVRLAAATGLPVECVLPGAGSSPQLYLIARLIPAVRPCIIGPAFAEYEAALRVAGRVPAYVLTREEDDWLVTGETIRRLFARRPDMVFLAHPANPTGRLVPFEMLSELADECHRRGVWLVADEAFIDFTGGRSLLPLAERHPRLIVLRSLTKIFALPGLRLAFLAAHPETVARLAARMEPWFLSSLAISAGHFCLQQKDFRTATAQETARLRAHLAERLAALNFCRVFPSESNYVLIKLHPALDHCDYLDTLFQAGILVRDASNFQGLAPGFLRLAVRPLAEVDLLIERSQKYLERKNA